ncbi:hypothetical protein [Lactiplantibacillus paraxiangfangensis]|uniref:hypothetical protein n=1 Tax=Lactiplantibacillus paraxiangfangensis TaxID=3076224 RepID=UPI0030C7066F
MDSLPILVPGEAGWDKIWNDNAAKIVAAINGATEDSGWITNGITLINGFTEFGGSAYDTLQYRYVSLGGAKKAVLVNGGLKVPDNLQADNWMDFCTVPDDLNQFILDNPAVKQGFSGFVSGGSVVAMSFNLNTKKIAVRSKETIAEGDRLQVNYIGIA